MIKLDATTIVSYPTPSKWADYYERFRSSLVNSLNGRYCAADREDAVEEAFHKLMHKKDMAAYGEKMPQTESDWYWNLHWQARSFLSHIKSRYDLHAKYVETMSKELEDAFIPGLQGVALDSQTRAEALVKALHHFTYRKHEVAVLHVMAEEELTFDFDGHVHFENLEGDDEMMLDAKSIRAGYLEQVNAFLRKVGDGVRKMGADYAPMNTKVPFDKALVEYLSRRRSGGR